MDDALVTTGLHQTFRGGRVALDGPDLAVPSGSVCGYLGGDRSREPPPRPA